MSSVVSLWNQVKLFGSNSHMTENSYTGISISVANSQAEVGQNPTTIPGAILCGTTDEFSFDRLHAVPNFYTKDNNSTISCDGGTHGRYVHVSKNSASIFIMEIEVYAREPGEIRMKARVHICKCSGFSGLGFICD